MKTNGSNRDRVPWPQCVPHAGGRLLGEKRMPPDNSNPPFERLLSCSPVVPPRRLAVARFSPPVAKIEFRNGLNCSIDASPFVCVSCTMPNAVPITRRPSVRALVLLLTDRGEDYTTIAAQASLGENECAPARTMRGSSMPALRVPPLLRGALRCWFIGAARATL